MYSETWSKTIFIISDYTLAFNTEIGFFVESRESPPNCSECGGELAYRDSRKRILRKEGGEKCWVQIRRFRCKNCGRHHNELPDCLVPHKHYVTEAIAGVLDDVVTPEDEDSENYPTEQTMIRWKKWFALNKANIEGHLRNIGYSILGLGKDILIQKDSLLEHLRKQRQDWLERVLRLIYNTGESLRAIPW